MGHKNNPFFTVLIPTMNRPTVLSAAIKTVLWQTFTDFELIVSDNSNDQDCIVQNRIIIEQFTNANCLNYITPPTWMNMPDHWEFASRHARGEYLVILTDRHVMRPSALEYLFHEIQKYPREKTAILSWYDSSIYDDETGILITPDFSGDTKIYHANEILSDYLKYNDYRKGMTFSNRLPRMLNSCCRNDLARKIRRLHGRLFFPLSPDFTSAFLLLAYAESITYLDRPLFISHGDMGNGFHGLKYGVERYTSTLNEKNIYGETPVPLNTIYNIILRDFLFVRRIVGKYLSNIHVNWVGFYIYNYNEIMLKKKLGSPMDLKALVRIWRQGVEKLPIEQQNKVIQELKRINKTFSLHRIVEKMKRNQYLNYLIQKTKHLRQRLFVKTTYPDILDAAKRTDSFLIEK